MFSIQHCSAAAIAWSAFVKIIVRDDIIDEIIEILKYL